MEEPPENGKESLPSAHANGMNESFFFMQTLCARSSSMKEDIVLFSFHVH